jgi:hypothetical protein
MSTDIGNAMQNNKNLIINQYLKIFNIRSLILLISITIISFFLITAEFKVLFTDGAWIIGDKIYGFPLPYIYDNVVSSGEHSIIILYLILDLIVYFIIAGIIYFLIKIIILKFNINYKFNNRIQIFFISLLNAVSIIFIIFHIVIAILLNYSISWNLNYYGDSLKFYTLYIGIHWL